MAVANRRDQVLAYRFLLRRRHAGLLAGDPDSVEAPLRKLGTASFAGVMLTVLCVAGAGIFGVLSPGHSTAWRDGKSIVVVKETGSRFLYLNGQLRPVLNYTSARLLLAQSGWKSVSVSQKSLAGVPRGMPLGIPGAPDDLPPRAGVLGLPWSVCSLPAPDADHRAVTQTVIGASGSAAVRSPAALPADTAILAQRSDSSLWLVYHDHRLRVGDAASRLRGARPDAAAQALFDSAPTPLAVTDAWLDSVAAGPDLAAPAPVGTLGGPGPKVAGTATKVGQVVHAQAPGLPDQWYLAGTDTLTQITQTKAALAMAAYHDFGTELTVARTDVAALAVAQPTDPLLPDQAPHLLNATASGRIAACTVFDDPAGLTPGHVVTGPADETATPHLAADRLPPVDAPGVYVADTTDMAPGKCALIRVLPGDGSSQGTVYLVTDYGGYAVKFPLADPSAQEALGYKGVTPTPVPAPLAALVRTGPRLGAADASVEAAPGVGGPTGGLTTASSLTGASQGS